MLVFGSSCRRFRSKHPGAVGASVRNERGLRDLDVRCWLLGLASVDVVVGVVLDEQDASPRLAEVDGVIGLRILVFPLVLDVELS